jgi:hypothetical protein
VASNEGRKTGNLARHILDQWARNRQEGNKKEKK